MANEAAPQTDEMYFALLDNCVKGLLCREGHLRFPSLASLSSTSVLASARPCARPDGFVFARADCGFLSSAHRSRIIQKGSGRQ